MKYRINRRTGSRISEIGLGTAALWEAGMEEGVRALRTALEGGINYYDLATSDASMFPVFGEAFAADREKVQYQVHFGADYTQGAYGWSLEADRVRASVEYQLQSLKTDYVDFGFIHCQDEHSDWETYQKNGVLRYLEDMKRAGVVRHIGLSSHTPDVIERILDTGLVDMLMFSVNPGYDYSHGEYAHGSVEERQALYTRCEREGIGISVMKPFSGGQLLDKSRSPFGMAMTRFQCIQYALDRPGVLTVLPGVRNEQDVKEILRYEQASDAERDYSVLGGVTPREAAGICVYCNHCRPCPAGLDIGMINKFYDLARLGDAMAAEHYRQLDKNAADCVGCGHCDSRCPFGVKQVERMQEIRSWFAEN